MQEVKETPTREVELEGYKALQYQIMLPNSLGNFLLTPVFPTQHYLDSYFDEYKKMKDRNTPEAIETFLGKPARSIHFPNLDLLFIKDRKMAKGYVTDSWRDFNLWEDLKKELLRHINLASNARRKLEALGNLQPAIDKLQFAFEKSNVQPLSVIYDTAVKMIDIKDAGTPAELAYIDFLESAMANFEDILRRNVGVQIGIFEIRFFNILFRKQLIFNNRILAYDLPRIIRSDDMGLDRILTPLLMLGWGIELDATFSKTSKQIQKLTERFLKLYLTAQTWRAFYEREVERQKQETQQLHKGGIKELSFNQFESEDGEGNLVIAQELNEALAEPSFLEQLETEEDKGILLDKLTPRQKEIAELLLKGFEQREIAKRLGVSEAFISQQRKLIGKRIKL